MTCDDRQKPLKLEIHPVMYPYVAEIKDNKKNLYIDLNYIVVNRYRKRVYWNVDAAVGTVLFEFN